MKTNAQPYCLDAVTQQRIGTKHRNLEVVEIEAQQEDQHNTISQKDQQSRCRNCDLPLAKQNDQAEHRQCKSRQRQLPQKLVAKPPHELEPVDPSRAGAGIDVDVPLPADVEPDFLKCIDRAVEINQYFMVRPPDHPDIWKNCAAHENGQEQREFPIYCAPNGKGQYHQPRR